MKEGVLIRRYEAKDKLEIIHLLRLNTPAYFSAEEEKDLVYYLGHELEQYFVLEQNNTLIGCGGINFSDNGTTGKISWDILHPDYHGQGLGSRLLNHRISILKSLAHIKLISVRTSQMAYKFYEKQGFTLVEIKKDYWAKGFDLYDMRYNK